MGKLKRRESEINQHEHTGTRRERWRDEESMITYHAIVTSIISKERQSCWRSMACCEKVYQTATRGNGRERGEEEPKCHSSGALPVHCSPQMFMPPVDWNDSRESSQDTSTGTEAKQTTAQCYSPLCQQNYHFHRGKDPWRHLRIPRRRRRKVSDSLTNQIHVITTGNCNRWLNAADCLSFAVCGNWLRSTFQMPR